MVSRRFQGTVAAGCAKRRNESLRRGPLQTHCIHLIHPSTPPTYWQPLKNPEFHFHHPGEPEVRGAEGGGSFFNLYLYSLLEDEGGRGRTAPLIPQPWTQWISRDTCLDRANVVCPRRFITFRKQRKERRVDPLSPLFLA